MIKVPGSRADTTAAIERDAKKLYYASHNWNPFFLEGMKTLAFEVCEQLDWNAPDAILCPVGFGSIYLGLYRGFEELVRQGIVSRFPRLIGVQVEAVSPIYQAFSRKADEVTEVSPRTTLGEGIACVRPVRGKEILSIARSTQGGFEIVSEDGILEGWKELNRKGIYVEPTSAVVVKAIDTLAQKHLLNRRETIVLILTGSGLKATETWAQYIDAQN